MSEIVALYADGGVIGQNPSPFGGTWADPRVIARFWSKVEQRGADECWPWKASVSSQGYGKFYFGGRMDHAHRVALRIARQQDIDPGAVVRHACDNRICVNPAHLSLGTHADNTADMMRRGRNKYIIPVRYGESHSQAKLTLKQVRHIKELLATGMPKAAIGRLFGVCRATIRKIAKGETWATS